MVKPTEQIYALQEYMELNQLSQLAMADKLDITRQYLNLILRGNKPITSKLALKLESVTFRSSQFWLGNLQGNGNLKDDEKIVNQWQKMGYRMLVDHEIKTAVNINYIKINPFNLNNLEPTSYCLTLGNRMLLNNEEQPIILTSEDPFIELQPGDNAAILSNEYISIPRNVSAILNPTTTVIDKIFSIKNGGKVHPGYEGKIYFMLTNDTNSTIPLSLGDKILRIEFIFLPITPENIYTGDKQKLREFPEEFEKTFFKKENEVINSSLHSDNQLDEGENLLEELEKLVNIYKSQNNNQS